MSPPGQSLLQRPWCVSLWHDTEAEGVYNARRPSNAGGEGLWGRRNKHAECVDSVVQPDRQAFRGNVVHAGNAACAGYEGLVGVLDRSGRLVLTPTRKHLLKLSTFKWKGSTKN